MMKPLTLGRIDSPLNEIGTVHFARFVLLEASTGDIQPGVLGGPLQAGRDHRV